MLSIIFDKFVSLYNGMYWPEASKQQFRAFEVHLAHMTIMEVKEIGQKD